MSLASFLAVHSLDEYAFQFQAKGFSHIEDFYSLSTKQIEDLATECQMKMGHKFKFRKLVQDSKRAEIQMGPRTKSPSDMELDSPKQDLLDIDNLLPPTDKDPIQMKKLRETSSKAAKKSANPKKVTFNLLPLEKPQISANCKMKKVEQNDEQNIDESNVRVISTPRVKSHKKSDERSNEIVSSQSPLAQQVTALKQSFGFIMNNRSEIVEALKIISQIQLEPYRQALKELTRLKAAFTGMEDIDFSNHQFNK